MARQFGTYSPSVPLGITWVESIDLEDSTGAPVDLTGYEVIAQLYAARPARDPDTGIAVLDPVMELVTAGAAYSPAPTWPVFTAISVPTPSNGRVLIELDVEDLWTASPNNAKRKLFWSIVLVNPTGDVRIPVVTGVVPFLRATTMRPPL